MVVFSSSNDGCLVSDKEMVQLDVVGVVGVIRFLRCSGSCSSGSCSVMNVIEKLIN